MKRSALLVATLATVLFAALGHGSWHAPSALVERGAVSASSGEQVNDYHYRKCQVRHWRDCMLHH